MARRRAMLGSLNATWRLGRWRGVPIELHWTVWLGLPWLFYKTGSVVATLAGFAAFLLLLLAHELGHAAVALWRKVRVLDVRLYVLHGLCTHEEPYYETDDVLIAWGGVTAQFIVLLLALAAEPLVAAASPDVHRYASGVLHVLIDINVITMVVNLIPVAPLDGSKAWRAIPLLRARVRTMSWMTRARKRNNQRQRARDKKLEEESNRVVVDIIDRLKKGKRDA